MTSGVCMNVFFLRWGQPTWGYVMHMQARKIVQDFIHLQLSLIQAARREFLCAAVSVVMGGHLLGSLTDSFCASVNFSSGILGMRSCATAQFSAKHAATPTNIIFTIISLCNSFNSGDGRIIESRFPLVMLGSVYALCFPRTRSASSGQGQRSAVLTPMNTAGEQRCCCNDLPFAC